MEHIFYLPCGKYERNVLRSFLTILGIVIGVAAVITMVTVGGGAPPRSSSKSRAWAATYSWLRRGRDWDRAMATATSLFKEADADAIAEEMSIPLPRWPLFHRNRSKPFSAIKTGRRQLTGSDNVLLKMTNRSVKSGRQFNDSELRSGAAVCILGETVKKKLFGGQDAVGEKFRLEKISCEVIGILEAKGQNTMGMDQDDVVVIPLRTLSAAHCGQSGCRSDPCIRQRERIDGKGPAGDLGVNAGTTPLVSER